MSTNAIRLGLRINARQFSLLVALNAFVGAMVGLERSVLPLIGEEDFELSSTAAIVSFVAAFGIAKAVANLAAGGLAHRVGRKRLLVIGWLTAFPVPLLIALAPSWGFIVAANLLLGVNQGLAWSMTVVMKIDLVGPRRRGLALGLNESAGYLGVAATAFASGALAATFAPRTVVWAGAALIAGVGLLISLVFVRDTGAHVELEQQAHDPQARAGSLTSAFARGTFRHPALRACSQAGLVNNLNDALAWGLAPLYLAAHGASVTQVAVIAAIYPAVWGVSQIATGWLSDHTGRRPLITAGMLVQAAALALLVASDGTFGGALAASALLGLGTALVYPTLIAAVSDIVQPVERAQAVGVYRFWRDFGFVAGALISGLVADALGAGWAISIVAGLTGASGLWVALTHWPRSHLTTIKERRMERTTADAMLNAARDQIAPRFVPEAAAKAIKNGALLIDLRSHDERSRSGVIPGSLHIPRSVLEWRLDPSSGWSNPHIGGFDRQLILMCAEGCSSSFAAVTARKLGYETATDLDGGFEAWATAGLPVRHIAIDLADTEARPGLGEPEPHQLPHERDMTWAFR
jgi:MFS family permease